MGAEGIPVLDVSEVATALAGDHYLPPGAGHLLQKGHGCFAAGGNQGGCGSIRRHQAGGTSAYDYDV